MGSTRTTLYLDNDLNDRLRRFVPPRGLNRFINEALAEKVGALERREIEEKMKEGYLAIARDRAELNSDWKAVDIEIWPA
jgi:hypothetical protein